MGRFWESLTDEERITHQLRLLLEQYGYQKVRVRKFEEYALYGKNKDFLNTEHIITFMDLGGKLLALRPDVTLSIVKNLDAGRSSSFEKLYYLEKVYRLSKQSHEFREISQMGLECIGEIDPYTVVEAVSLALQSLLVISKKSLLEVSHMGFLSGLLEKLCLSPAAAQQVITCIRAKNADDLALLTRELPSCAAREVLLSIPSLYGPFPQVLQQAQDLCQNDAMRRAVCELNELYAALCEYPLTQSLCLDFSLANDLNYYNGIIFQGYIQGVPRAVLSGGQYDRLLHKLGKLRGAVGFAIYLDELEHFYSRRPCVSADVLLLYDSSADCAALCSAVQSLISQGKRVRVERERPEGLRFSQILSFQEGHLREVD